MFVDIELIEDSNQNQVVIDLTRFDTEKLRISYLNDLLQIEYLTPKGWEPFPYDPGFPIISDFYKANNSHPFSIFQFLAENSKLVGISRYIHLQSLIIRQVITSKHSWQLYADAPFLFWMILNEYETEGIEHILTRKRIEILREILGFGCNKHVNIIRKIIPTTGLREEITRTKRALADEEIIEEFSHWKSIPAKALEIASKYPILLGTRILKTLEGAQNDRAIEMSNSMASAVSLFLECLRIGQSIGFKSPESILAKIPSIKRLSEIHDRWTKILNRQSTYLKKDKKLPRCALKDSPAIKQISTINDLISEGKFMQHCVGSYTTKVLEKESYIFRVIEPERATLELTLRNNVFRVSQIKGHSNEDVSELTLQKVKTWLDEENKRYSAKLEKQKAGH